jgi:hypothetical protein
MAHDLVDVGIDHCCLQAAVPKQQLDRSNIRALGQQVRGE